jgi:hypothetical protein
LDKIYGFPKPDKPDEKATTDTRKSKKLMKWSFNSPPSPPCNKARSKGLNPLLALFYAFCCTAKLDEKRFLTSNLTSMGENKATGDI